MQTDFSLNEKLFENMLTSSFIIADDYAATLISSEIMILKLFAGKFDPWEFFSQPRQEGS